MTTSSSVLVKKTSNPVFNIVLNIGNIEVFQIKFSIK